MRVMGRTSGLWVGGNLHHGYTTAARCPRSVVSIALGNGRLMYLRTGNFDNERNKRWVAASVGLRRVEEFMIPTVQGLGLLDCKLSPEDERFGRLSQEEQSTFEESVMLTERFMLSSLWVMGAYELVRTIDQLAREDNIFVVGEVAECVKHLKRPLERIRMPLAKMETADRFPGDFPIVQPYIMPGHGVAWRVSDEVLFSRRQLSDGLLNLLELIHMDMKLQAQQEGSSAAT